MRALITGGAGFIGSHLSEALLDDQLDADGGGEMEDDIAAIDQLREQRLVLDGVDEVLESRAPFQVRNVIDRPGREVVEDEDLVPELEQPFGEVRPDEAGAAGNERSHVTPDKCDHEGTKNTKILF